nr:MAG TPA: hypothetical protein [Caudoviricetes sp.]
MVFTKTAKINNLTLVYELFGNTEQLKTLPLIKLLCCKPGSFFIW